MLYLILFFIQKKENCRGAKNKNPESVVFKCERSEHIGLRSNPIRTRRA